jgi:hypothetical protein
MLVDRDPAAIATMERDRLPLVERLVALFVASEGRDYR